GATLAVLALYVAARPRTRMPLASIVVVTLLAFGIASAWASRWNPAGAVVVGGFAIPAAKAVWLRAGAALAMAMVLWAAKDRAYQLSLSPVFFGGTGMRALAALTDAVIPAGDRPVPPAEVARAVDGYLVGIRAVRRFLYPWVLRAVQWHPVFYLKAPLSELDRELAYEHLRQHFEIEPGRGVVPRFYDRLLHIVLAPFRGAAKAIVNLPQLGAEELIRVSKQLVYVGYYADPRTFPKIGYRVFEERDRAKELKRQGLVPSPGVHPLKVHLPIDLAGDRPEVKEADVVIVGTGAGGAVLAHHLALEGKSVVMLEKGQYVEPRSMTPNEVEMFGKLYADGVFQQTEDFRFTVLQGNAVGGTTVVNNAVSFATPPRVLERWNREFQAGIDPADYAAATEEVKRLISIRPQVEKTPWGPHQRVNPSAPLYLEGIQKLGIPESELARGPVEANVCNCIGCGYCNIGCRYGAKLSMLDTLLPASQRTRYGQDAVRIYAEAQATRIGWANGGPTKRATHVEAVLADGRTLTVRAPRVILSAGTIASSYLLQQSRIGRGLPVGKGVCFNMGSPLTAEFRHAVDAFDGLQISHFGIPDPERGWVYETWFNPPVSQAINMPGWFEDHFRNMQAYSRLMAVGVLVGTERNATIGKAMTGGPAVHYAPTQGDLRKLADGLAELGRILLAAPGAQRVMLNTWKYREYTDPDQLMADLQEVIRRPGELTLGTGHPQGGNAISADPKRGVVGPDFRVHGFDNLYVCDASVIPTSLTVNPQLTVMSLAHYAAPRIGA
ncbi:MAG TPA: GMC family oxidoreductase, partial [Longimicrobiaceae bacterium]|nr:GMC family oxidoreductase [Longimicrobiaceae bacterium]